MDYTKMSEKELAEIIDREATKQGIMDPKEQLRYMAEKNKSLVDAFVDKIMQAW